MTILLPAQPTIGYRARSRSTAEYPSLWDGLVSAWNAELSSIDDLGPNRQPITTADPAEGTDFVRYRDGYRYQASTWSAENLTLPAWSSKDLTVHVRAYHPSSSAFRTLSDGYATGAGFRLGIASNGTQYRLLTQFGTPQGGTVTNNVEFSLCGTSRQGFGVLYYNGATIASASTSTNYSSTSVVIGSNSWVGGIQHHYLWRRALSAKEIAILHADPFALFRRKRRVLFVPVVGGVTITPASCTHAHTSDAPSVTQTHQITAGDATHSHTADSPAITQTHVVSVAEATHAHAADSPTVTQTHVVAAADSTHGHTADNVTVSVDAVSVTPADATHVHTAEQPAITQTHVIVVAEATHGHTADSPAITQTQVIAVASALHSHTADNVTVSLSAAVAASQFWVCIGLEGWCSDRVGIEGWLAEALGLEEYLATAKGIE